MENQTVPTEIVYVAFELNRKKWKLGFSDGNQRQIRQITINAGDLERVAKEIAKAKQRFGLSTGARVGSCYEAGREGFWLHRALEEMQIENIVVDAASIEVNRRQRRAKTDRMDVEKLIEQLIRYYRGERRALAVVRVPRGEDEDRRHLHRALEVLKEERKRHRVRIQSLLWTQGIAVTVKKGFLKQLERLSCWNHQPVAEGLKRRLEDEYHRLQLVDAQIREIEKSQREGLKGAGSDEAIMNKIAKLQRLISIGMGSSWVFVMELFGWRTFRNRRELAGAVGLTPTPYDSGDSVREQGISRAGNHRVRKLIMEIAWCWLRLQPNSKLSEWYRQRFGGGGARMRRIGIVAVARRLLIDLWRYLESGLVPEGATVR